MKILGREIQINKIAPLLIHSPQASLIGAMQKLRQRIFIDSLFNGYSLPPSTITIEVTYNCNLRCKTCWFYGNKGIIKDYKKYNQSLNFSQLKKIIDGVKSFKPYLYFTGGEPLINKDFIKGVEYAKRKGLVVGMVTNGTLLTREKIEELINTKIDFITISLDGKKEIHDKIRGVNCFEKTTQGIDLLVEERGEKSFPIITLNCTISDYNFNALEKMVEIGKDLGVDIVALQHPCFLRKSTIKAHHKIFKRLFGKSDELVDGFENGSAEFIGPKKLYNSIWRIKKKYNSKGLRIYQDFSEKETIGYYYDEAAINSSCINPWFAATIKPNGDVTPCLNYVVGNINEESFKKIWNGIKFKKFRKILKERKYFPACIRCCGFFLNW